MWILNYLFIYYSLFPHLKCLMNHSALSFMLLSTYATPLRKGFHEMYWFFCCSKNVFKLVYLKMWQQDIKSIQIFCYQNTIKMQGKFLLIELFCFTTILLLGFLFHMIVASLWWCLVWWLKLFCTAKEEFTNCREISFAFWQNMVLANKVN